jgi:excisionase family DNA binding protein
VGVSVSAADRHTPPPESDPWLNRRAAAAYLGISPRRLDAWTQDGKVEAHRNPGGRRRWRRSDLDAVFDGDE